MHDDGIELKATWREEWVVNAERRYTHGGILATLVDLGADWAMVSQDRPRRARPIDMRVDYHAARDAGRSDHQGQGDRAWAASSRWPKPSIYDAQGKLLASGRGTYFTAPPPPPKAQRTSRHQQ